MSWPWDELGLPGPAGLPEVRRAYAERLKSTHPEEDPEGFQRLHEAYQQARRVARKTGNGSSAPQEPAQEREEEACRDGGRAAEERGGEKEGEEAQQDWDFEAIFSQQAAQRARERERRAQERRNAYFARHKSACAEELERLEEQWPRVEKALAAVEELHAVGAPLYSWTAFLYSGAFFAVKGDEYFIAGLEDFLRRTPELGEQVKAELSKAFSLRRKDVPPIWQGLRELLTAHAPEGAAEQESGHQGKKLKKRWPFAAAALGLLTALSLAASRLPAILDQAAGFSGREERELLCRYMEEDFGRAVESCWEGRDNYENLYAPWDQPDLMFMAWPEGERDLTAGRRGYTTNYGNVMVTQAVKSFAKEQGWELGLLQEGGCEGVMGAYGTSPGGYVLRLPLTGGGDGITALGRLLAELEQESWYEAFPPSFRMIFAYQDLSYYSYASGEPFDAAAARDYYENKAGAALCAFLAEESGLAREDFGGDGYELEPQGPVELDGRTYFQVRGVERGGGETVRQYLFNGIELASLPAEEFSLDMKAYQLSGERFNSEWEELPKFIWISRK